jgi:hypothetical protein
MPCFIAILEDDSARVRVMQECLELLLPDFQSAIFEAAPKMIAWLADHLADAALISLDHDLPVIRVDGIEGGSGRDVADYLAAIPPTCPVVVHSSNAPAAAGMIRVLSDAGWPVWQVNPYLKVQ